MSNLLQGPPPQLPPGGIAQMFGQQPPDQDDHSPDPLSAVQEAIDGIHGLMVTLTDPQEVNNVAGCLKILTGIQARMMQSQGG